MPKKLQMYKAKRNLKATPEPAARVKRSKKGNIFVIQQHHASHMHYDFRLESEGVLVSWAIPKGPSTNPDDKRLAAQTEDHPLDYATFEGIIPRGYGAGTVIVWDTGTYDNLTEKNHTLISIQDGLEKGHVKIMLHGKKLNGVYNLIKFKKEEKDWLLIKADDEFADARRNPVATEPMSVLSRKTIQGLDKIFLKDKKKKK